METVVSASFKDLVVWQRAVQLSTEVYHLTDSFPPSERFGLSNQMRRASVSIASNVAEGYGRSTRGEYVQFLGHARGSNCELQTQFTIAKTSVSAPTAPMTWLKNCPPMSAGCSLRS